MAYVIDTALLVVSIKLLIAVMVDGQKNESQNGSVNVILAETLKTCMDQNAELVKRSCNAQEGVKGTTYVRWGKMSCPASTAILVYKGFVAGKGRADKGSGTNVLCLHENPNWGRYLDGNQGARATIYGGEYEPDDGKAKEMMPGMNAINDKNTPCSVCRMMKHRDVLMIPGTNVCETGWTKEYDGYLMTTKAGDVGASEYICVDKTADVSPGGKNSNQFLLYPVEVKCGTLKCPPFVEGREMTCVVCSI